jgi:hypothetical protein
MLIETAATLMGFAASTFSLKVLAQLETFLDVLSIMALTDKLEVLYKLDF